MKKFLITIAVLLALLAAVLVIGPSFINWNDHKAAIIAAVRDATGRNLTIDGDISLQIIPAPALSVHDVRLAGLPGAGSPPILSLKALEVRVALAPLLSGEIQVTSVRLIEPRLVLEVSADGQTNWQFKTAGDGAGQAGGAGAMAGLDLTLDKLAVDNATVVYRDHRSGLEERFENIDMDGSAASLQGPFRFKGRATARGLPIGFDLSVEAIAGNKPIGVRLVLKLAGDTAQASFAGRIEDLDEAPRLAGQLNISAKNAAALHAVLVGNGKASAVPRQPFQLKASVEASAKAANLNNIDITFGPLQGSGAISATFGETPSYDLALTIGRLDIDRLLEGIKDAGGSSGAASGAAPDTTGGDGAGPPGGLSIPEIPANLNASVVVTIEGLRYRGGVISQVQFDASTENGVLRLERLSALLPGGSDLRISGDGVKRDGVPQFDGTIELASNNLRGLLSWLNVDLADIPAGRLANMVLTSDFAFNPSQAQISNMNLRLDSTTIEGAATVLLQSRPSFGLALNIDRINLDGYLPNRTGAANSTARKRPRGDGDGESKIAANPLAVLEQFDSNLVLNIGELTYNAAPIKGLSLELGLAAGKLTVRKAAIQNLAGASFSMSGSAEGFAGSPTGKAKLRLRAKYLDGLARLAGVELPVPPKRLKGLTLDGDISGDADGLTFDIATTLAGLKAKFSGRVLGWTEQPETDLKFALKHASLAALSRTFELGIKPLARADTPLNISGAIRGGNRALDLELTANLAGGEFHAKGRLTDLETVARVDVMVNAAHEDLASLLAALGNQFPADQKSPGAVRVGAAVKGGGGRFDLSNLEVTVGALDLTGTAGVDLAGARLKLSADLQAGDVIVDHFLGAAAGQKRSVRTAKSPAKSPTRQRRGDGRWSRDAIDLSALQTLDADIKLSAKRLVFQRYPFEEPRLHLILDNGVLQIKELTGRLFKGDVGIRATLNSQPLPGLGLSVRLRGADINEAMRTALELDQVTGLLDFSGQFQTTGSSQWDLVNALSGQVKIHAANGVIRGFDMKSFSERLGRLNKVPDFLNLLQRAFSGGETKYQSVDGTWNIKNGVAETQDMLVRLDAAEATVKGKVRLPAWNMDLRAILRLTEHRDAPDMGAHLYGPLDQPERDLKTAKLERWLLARLGRELLGKNLKNKGLGKLLDALTGGGKSSAPQRQQPSTVQPSVPQPSQPTQTQPRQSTDPTRKLIEGLFKSLKRN